MQGVGEPQEGEAGAVTLQDGQPRENGGGADDNGVQSVPRPVGAEGDEVGRQTCRDGQEHRQTKQNSVHVSTSLTR